MAPLVAFKPPHNLTLIKSPFCIKIRESSPSHVCEISTLNQRATGPTPGLPTNFYNTQIPPTITSLGEIRVSTLIQLKGRNRSNHEVTKQRDGES